MGMRSIALAVMVGLALLLAAALAVGAEQTRDGYVAQVEPICKTNTEANGRILKGVKGMVKAGKLKPAAVKVAKAARALKQTLNKLRAVPPPPADRAKLTKWLGYIKTEVQQLEATAAQLRAGNKTRVQEMQVRLTSTVRQADNVVLGFEFKYCSPEASQFTG